MLDKRGQTHSKMYTLYYPIDNEVRRQANTISGDRDPEGSPPGADIDWHWARLNR